MYEKLIDKIKKIDERNIIKIDNTVVNKNAPKIYKYYDFVDVEIEIEDNMIKFFSKKDLDKYNKLYSYIDADFVFASINGDPVFIKNKKVFTCSHDGDDSPPEFLFDSFDDLLDFIMML